MLKQIMADAISTRACSRKTPNFPPFDAADKARARGMAQLAKDAGLGRESLYKALTPEAKPRYDTVLKLLHALGVKLSASPVHS